MEIFWYFPIGSSANLSDKFPYNEGESWNLSQRLNILQIGKCLKISIQEETFHYVELVRLSK